MRTCGVDAVLGARTLSGARLRAFECRGGPPDSEDQCHGPQGRTSLRQKSGSGGEPTGL